MWDAITGFLLLAGAVFILVAAVGVLRLPDVLTRMQATSKATTLGLAGIMAAAALHAGTLETAVRATFIVVFAFLTAPIGAHMIGRAAHRTAPASTRRLVVDELAKPPMQASSPSPRRPARRHARSSDGSATNRLPDRGAGTPSREAAALVCVGPGDDPRDTLAAAALDRHFSPERVEVLCPEGFEPHHVRAWSSLALDRLHARRHDILVMGSPGARPEFEAAARVLVRRSPVPVWFSQRPEYQGQGPLIVAIDAPSDRRRAQAARDLLQEAAAVARVTGRACHVVHTWTAFGDDLLSSHARPDEVEAYRTAEARRAQAMVHGIVAGASLDRAPEQVHIIHGEVIDVVPRLAGELGAGVVMMGTRGRRWMLTATLMPPRAEVLLPKINCALLVVCPGGRCEWASMGAERRTADAKGLPVGRT
jgi:multicomponent Na+:H+ antiporter subunit G